MADKVQIPTKKRIAGLPRWAQVAFAIRCARRVQPLFKAAWPEAPEDDVVAVEQAIHNAERQLAAYITISHADHGVLNTAIVAAIAAARIAESTASDSAARAAQAAIAAHAAATYATTAETPEANGRVARAASAEAHTAAALAATHAAHAIHDVTTYNAVGKAIRRDFETLKALSRMERWTDETRPSLESLGPLWLEGEEPDWKEVARRAKKYIGFSYNEDRLVLTAYVDKSEDDDTLVEGIIELYRALNKYHILCGGSGLTVDDWRIRVPARAPEGVPA